MARTATRPVPSGRISPRAALTFGIVLAVAVVRRCWRSRSTCWPRALALSGFLGYVFVYTIWLKRSTPQNIVIGGAAGAVPPLVGWAAVTGSLDPAALYLFAIVFYWTPPHFWALVAADEGRVRAGRRADDAGRPRRGRDAPPDHALHACCSSRSRCCRSPGGFFGGIYAAAAARARRRFLVARGAPAARRRTAAARCASTCSRSLYLALLFGAMVADVKL